MALVRVSVQLTISRLSLSFVTETAVRQMLLNQNRCGRTPQTCSVCTKKVKQNCMNSVFILFLEALYWFFILR